MPVLYLGFTRNHEFGYTWIIWSNYGYYQTKNQRTIRVKNVNIVKTSQTCMNLQNIFYLVNQHKRIMHKYLVFS